MTCSDYSLRQIDEEPIGSLPEEAVWALAVKLLNDLKEARERLNRNSQNSSVPPGSEAPWDQSAGDSDDEEEAEEDAYALPDEEAMKDSDSNASDDGNEKKPREEPRLSRADSESHRKPGKQPGAQGFGRGQRVFRCKGKHLIARTVAPVVVRQIQPRTAWHGFHCV